MTDAPPLPILSPPPRRSTRRARALSLLGTAALLAALRPPTPTPTSADLCLEVAHGVTVGVPCPSPQEHLALAPAALRRRAGAAPCWWRASPERFADVPGVGLRLGERLAAARDAGMQPSPEQLIEVRGVGEALSRRLVRELDVQCSGAPTDERDRARGSDGKFVVW